MSDPNFIYGTAWKDTQTSECVKNALKSGFRAFDTANQRKHYFEEGLGVALSEAINNGEVTREELFLQSKFTFSNGQDHRLPYDAKDTITQQVLDSFQSSLDHLNTHYLDSFILHGPLTRNGLTSLDWEAWTAMEGLKKAGLVRKIGVSNFDLNQLTNLFSHALEKPSFIQNRCFTQLGWDLRIREFCREKNMVYQGFSLLTANNRYFQHPTFLDLREKNQLSPAQLVFSFAKGVGILPLTGTTNPEHMTKDLHSLSIDLPKADIAKLEAIAF